MSPADMKLLPQTQFSLIPQMLIMGSNRHNFLLGKTLWSLTSTQLGLVSNLSTLWKTTYVDTVLWTSLAVIQPKLRSLTRSRTSSGPTTSVIGSLSNTIRIKTLLNGGIEPSKPGPTLTGFYQKTKSLCLVVT